MQIKIMSNSLSLVRRDALDQPFSFDKMLDDIDGLLSDEHPRASYGMPVLVVDGTAFGPADYAAIVGGLDPALGASDWRECTDEVLAWAAAGGWTLRRERYFDGWVLGQASGAVVEVDEDGAPVVHA